MSAALKFDYTNPKTNKVFQLPISIFKKPTNAKEYAKMEKILDELIDEVRGNAKHPLAIVLQIIGENLEQYDNQTYPPLGHEISDAALVSFLMTSHQLRQIDLADIFGGQANVSKFLKGERPLSKNQIAGLKKRFNISADFFLK